MEFHIVEFYNKFHPDPNDPDGVSYVGKWKYSSIEKHVKEFWTHVVGRSEISIEIAAVAGNIFISYQQGIKDESYVDAFMNQLSNFGVSAKLVRKMPVDVEMITEKVILYQ